MLVSFIKVQLDEDSRLVPEKDEKPFEEYSRREDTKRSYKNSLKKALRNFIQ